MSGDPELHLPSRQGFHLTSGAFEVPQATVTINLKPELLGEMLRLLAEVAELGAEVEWFRGQFEHCAAKVVESASGLEYMDALVRVAETAHLHDLLAERELDRVRAWAAQQTQSFKADRMPTISIRRDCDEPRERLQAWLDRSEPSEKKRFLRQRSIARVTCADCHSMLAWLVPQDTLEFLVLARGDHQDFEVGHAVGEYGGYLRTRCGRRKGGRFWVLHPDHLRAWLDEGHADVELQHSDKGM